MAALNSVYIEKPNGPSIRAANSTGAILYENEFTVLGAGTKGIPAVANEQIGIAAIGGFDVEPYKLVQASDLTAGENTFGTVNQPVYFNPATGAFSDTATVGYYLVGILAEAKSSAGVIKFFVLPVADEIESDET